MNGAIAPKATHTAVHLHHASKNVGRRVRWLWPLMVPLLLALLQASQAGTCLSHASPAWGETAPAAGTAAQPGMLTAFLPLVSRHDLTLDDPRLAIQMFDGAEEQVAEAAAAGAARVRIPAVWAAIEPQNTVPGEYRWSSTYERGLERMAASNMDLILTIEGNPTWAATYAGGPIDKVPISEFVQFVVALVERYSVPPYNVKLWEFYNEPDNGDPLWAVNSGLGYWGIDPEGYADMLTAVYQPIKDTDPEAQVLLGGIAFDFWEEDGGPFEKDFLERVLERGAGNSFDVMNFHYYPTAFAPRWNPYGPGIIGKTRFLRQMLGTYGLDKPMICTEAGVENVNTGTDEIQSRYVPILYAQAMAADLVSLSWFMLVDQNPGYWKTGLLYADLARKPAFYAYQTASARLAESTYLDALSTEQKGTEVMEAYRFLARDKQTRLIVAWTNDGLTYPLSLPAARVFVVDKYGMESFIVEDVADGQKDGMTVVSVGSSPVYLYPEP